MSDLLRDHIHSPDPYADDDVPPPASRARVQYQRELQRRSMAEQQALLSPDSGFVPGVQFLLDPEAGGFSPYDSAVQFEDDGKKGPDLLEPMDATPFKELALVTLAINPELVGTYQKDVEAWVAISGTPGAAPGAAAKALAEILKKINPEQVGVYGPLLDQWAAQATGAELSATFPILAMALKAANPEMLPVYGPLLDQWSMGVKIDPAAVAAAPPEPLDFAGLTPGIDQIASGAPSHMLALGSLLKKANASMAGAVDEWAMSGAAPEGLLPILQEFNPDSATFDPLIQEWLDGGADPFAMLTLLGEMFPDIAPDLDILAQHVMVASTIAGPAALQPVQGRGGPNGDTSAVHAAAAQGVSGSGGQLPYADRIQSAFGKYDVSGIQSYTGGQAARANSSMGSAAYATGNKVAFKGSPDLHTAAHEAAHIVQQAAGVSLPGGVGSVGDKYEQHADAVASRVVSGQSAEGVLDSMTGGGRAAGVQRMVQQRTGAGLQFAKPATPPPPPPPAGGTPSTNASDASGDLEKQLKKRFDDLCAESVEATPESATSYGGKCSALKAELEKITDSKDGGHPIRISLCKHNAAAASQFAAVLQAAGGTRLDGVAAFKTQVEAAIKASGKTAALNTVRAKCQAMLPPLEAAIARDKLGLDDAHTAATAYAGHQTAASGAGLTTLATALAGIATACAEAKALIASALSLAPDGIGGYTSACMTARSNATAVGLTVMEEAIGDLDACAAAYRTVLSAYDAASYDGFVTSEAALGGAFTTIESAEPGARFISPALAAGGKTTFGKNRDLAGAADTALKALEELVKVKTTTGAAWVAARDATKTAIDAVPTVFTRLPTWFNGRLEVARKAFKQVLDDHVAEVLTGLTEIDVNLWDITDTEKGLKLARDGKFDELQQHMDKVDAQKLSPEDKERRTEAGQARVRQKHVSAGAGVAGGLVGGPIGAAGGRALAAGSMGGEAAYKKAKAEGAASPALEGLKAAWKAAVKAAAPGVAPAAALADLASFNAAVDKKNSLATETLAEQRKTVSDLEFTYKSAPDIELPVTLSDKTKELDAKEKELAKLNTEVKAKLAAATAVVTAVGTYGLGGLLA